MNLMTQVHQRISDTSFNWPYDPWEDDYYALHLLKLLSRTVEGRDIIHAVGSVTGNSGEPQTYQATIFTDSLIILGSIDAAAPENGQRPYPQHANVAAIPYSQVTAVTLHDIAHYGDSSARAVIPPLSFSVSLDGHLPISLRRPKTEGTDGQAQLFDSLLQRLAGA